MQALRALAAIAVVAHHSFRGAAFLGIPGRALLLPPPWLVQFGAAGVDVFFVISGFLMTYISEPYLSGRKPPTQFLAQRVIRIWPPYAVATLLACALIFLQSHHSRGALPFDFHAGRLASLVFIPSFNERGLLQPIIGPAWSLNYEIMFYACFALTLTLGRKLAFFKLAGVITLLFIVGRLSSPSVLHAFLGDAIVFEFLIGAAIGFSLKAGWFKPSRPLAWIAAAVILFALLNRCGFTVEQRLVAYGFPAAALFIGFVALEPRLTWPRLVTLLGDASYSIYLIHILVIYKLMDHTAHILQSHGLATISAFVSAMVALFTATVLGLAFYWFVERRLLRATQLAYNRFSGHPSKPPLVAQ